MVGSGRRSKFARTFYYIPVGVVFLLPPATFGSSPVFVDNYAMTNKNAECCPHCNARLERGDDGTCNRCGKKWSRERYPRELKEELSYAVGPSNVKYIGSNPNLIQKTAMNNDLLRLAASRLKLSMAPTAAIAPPPPPPAPAPGMPPMDPAMAGAPPMDPPMGGAPPMDPAMAGMPPMDPAMMDPAMAGPDPIIELMDMLKAIKREAVQTRKIVAIIADQLQVRVPLNDLLEEEEDPIKADPQAPAKEASDWVPNEQDGDAVMPVKTKSALYFEVPTSLKLSAAARFAANHFARLSNDQG